MKNNGRQRRLCLGSVGVEELARMFWLLSGNVCVWLCTGVLVGGLVVQLGDGECVGVAACGCVWVYVYVRAGKHGREYLMSELGKRVKRNYQL